MRQGPGVQPVTGRRGGGGGGCSDGERRGEAAQQRGGVGFPALWTCAHRVRDSIFWRCFCPGCLASRYRTSLHLHHIAPRSSHIHNSGVQKLPELLLSCARSGLGLGRLSLGLMRAHRGGRPACPSGGPLRLPRTLRSSRCHRPSSGSALHVTHVPGCRRCTCSINSNLFGCHGPYLIYPFRTCRCIPRTSSVWQARRLHWGAASRVASRSGGWTMQREGSAGRTGMKDWHPDRRACLSVPGHTQRELGARCIAEEMRVIPTSIRAD